MTKRLITKSISLLVAILVFASTSLRSQNAGYEFKPSQLIVPAVLIGVGAVGSQIDAFKEFDFGLRINNLHTHSGFVLEDAVQYAPVGAMYALKMGGIKSSHSYADLTVLTAASYCITASMTWMLKHVVDEKRPNGKDYDAFPSGHTAVSFMGAELLRLEYKDTSPWIGYAGYAAATYTSLARIRHSEHWMHDLVAGAGVGILGTRLAYWICPPIQKCLFGKCIEKHKNGFAFAGMPFYNGSIKGLSFAMVF